MIDRSACLPRILLIRADPCPSDDVMNTLIFSIHYVTYTKIVVNKFNNMLRSILYGSVLSRGPPIVHLRKDQT